MEQYGSTASFNVENVLRKNIVDSEYFRDTCGKLSSWEEVVDQIYYDVKDVEPWMSGNARGASTAFCLLYRLFTLAITEREVKDLLSHTDSPYIRALGFLYLRYVGNPKNHWDWIQPYVRDDEEFTPSPEGYGKAVTVGDFVRDVFLEQYYFETIFPRIPKPVHDTFVSKLTSMGLPSKALGNGGQGGGDRRGIEEPNRRPASVKASLSVAMGQRAPNRATAREEGRGLGAGMRGTLGGGGGVPRPSPSRTARDTEPRGDRPRESDKDHARPSSRDQDHGRSHRPDSSRGDRNRHGSSATYDRDRDRSRHHDRHSRDDRGSEYHRDRRPDQDRDRGRHERERERERDYRRPEPYDSRDGRRGPSGHDRDFRRDRR